MQYNDLITAITTVGFPIVCCLGFALFIFRDNVQQQAQNDKREERLFSMIEQFNSTIENLNSAIEVNNKRLEHIEKKVGE